MVCFCLKNSHEVAVKMWLGLQSFECLTGPAGSTSNLVHYHVGEQEASVPHHVAEPPCGVTMEGRILRVVAPYPPQQEEWDRESFSDLAVKVTCHHFLSSCWSHRSAIVSVVKDHAMLWTPSYQSTVGLLETDYHAEIPKFISTKYFILLAKDFLTLALSTSHPSL